MNILLAKTYAFNLILKDNQLRQLQVTVYVESRSGRLNTADGKIIPLTELDEAVNEVLTGMQGKPIAEIKGLAYLPATLEIIAIQLWEKIQESLSYKASMSKIKVASAEFFVEYTGKRDERKHKTKRKLQNG